MKRTYALALAVVACGNSPSPSTTTTVATTGSGSAVASAAPGVPTPTCDPHLPLAACKIVPDLRPCKSDDAQRVGEWRHALVAPPYSPVEDISRERLVAMWKGDDKVALAASEETRRALATMWGPAGGEVAPPDNQTLDDTHWMLIPAHELTPYGKVVSVAGSHPLDRKPGVLALPLCSGGVASKQPVRNIDPARLTILAMTGTTALTRYTAKLMEEKGVLYPLPAVEPWLASADLVHISNEVSFVPKCDAAGKPTMSFCSKNEYIELLEKSHTKIIELTGSHLTDYGRNWLESSIDMYAERGWIWFGGGRTQLEASTPRRLDHNGNKLAFLGCNKPWTDNRVLHNGAGPGACDLARMQWQIRELRAAGVVPIVSVQHDEVYKHDPPAQLVRDFRMLADAGPAYVMGSQAHCPHPWELHRGVYIHYGPGNLYFDQFWHPVRDAAHDKLYIHDGKLLTVGHMYTRTEERGRPRLLDERERAELLADLSRAQRRLPRGAEPWQEPIAAELGPNRPDSVVVGGAMVPLVVTMPAKTARSALIDLSDLRSRPAVPDDAIVVTVKLAPRQATPAQDKLLAAIEELVVARYGIAADQITQRTRDTAKPRPGKAKR